MRATELASLVELAFALREAVGTMDLAIDLYVFHDVTIRGGVISS